MGEETRKETLCWECKNACGGCSWSKAFKPVEGWDADKTTVKCENGTTYGSYHVKSCPEFIPNDRRIISARKIARILGVTPPTINDLWAKQVIVEKMAEKGYTVKYNWADRIWYEVRR